VNTLSRNLSPATFCGLLISLLSGPAFVAAYRGITGENHSNLQLVGREAGIFLLVGLLLWIVKRGEELPLASIGLHADRLGRSIIRGLVLTAISLAATVGLYLLLQQFGIHLGGRGADPFRPSLWVVALIMLRAGIAEEIFYRGYAIERLQSQTGRKWLARLLPLVLFAAAHYRQGLGGMFAVFILGGIFTMFYVKFRDLIANMTGHFLGDFVLNVGLPLLGAG